MSQIIPVRLANCDHDWLRGISHRPTFAIGILLMCLSVTGCSNTGETIGLAVGTTVLGAQSPGNEIEQIYYFGVYDPLEQVPPAFYRIRVHGQASAISLMRFGSGWIPAQLADSISTQIAYDSEQANAGITHKQGKGSLTEGISPQRRLVLYGPEGFREAPAQHRLVIVMGSNPEAYFQAVGQMLGYISPAAQKNDGLIQKISDELIAIDTNRKSLRSEEHT
ncbi:MAG: hypothetical protein ACF8OB_06420, partial [Phycisphaeraceae bacterium JB051]